MEKTQECIKKIQEIEKANFDYQSANICYQDVYATSLLRKALLVYNSIGFIDDTNERKKLRDQLDEVMIKKIRKLNPNFDDEILQNIISYYKRGIYQFPIDIYVLKDAVFSKEAVYNDFEELYKIKTFMYENNNKYFNIFDCIHFYVFDNLYEFYERGYRDLTKEQYKAITKFICDSINKILYEKLSASAVRPLFELQDEDDIYIIPFEIDNIAVYLNKKYYEIARAITNEEEIELRLLIRNEENIFMYNVQQKFINGTPVWEGVLYDEDVWNLSEAAIKFENNIDAPKRKLEDKK